MKLDTIILFIAILIVVYVIWATQKVKKETAQLIDNKKMESKVMLQVKEALYPPQTIYKISKPQLTTVVYGTKEFEYKIS